MIEDNRELLNKIINIKVKETPVEETTILDKILELDEKIELIDDEFESNEIEKEKNKQKRKEIKDNYKRYIKEMRSEKFDLSEKKTNKSKSINIPNFKDVDILLDNIDKNSKKEKNETINIINVNNENLFKKLTCINSGKEFIQKTLNWKNAKEKALMPLLGGIKEYLNVSFKIISKMTYYITLYPIKLMSSNLLKLSSFVFGPAYKIMKYMTTMSLKPLKWFLSVGTKALGYIWEGVSEIFKVGFTAIKYTTSILGFGLKTFFKWYTNLIINTITLNPFVLIPGAVILFFTTDTIMYILKKSLKTSSTILKWLQQSFDFVDNVVSIVWDSISNFFGNVLKMTGIDKVYNKITDYFYDLIFDISKNTFGESNTSYIFTWIKSFIDDILHGDMSIFKNVKNVLFRSLEFLKHFDIDKDIIIPVNSALMAISKELPGGDISSSLISQVLEPFTRNLSTYISNYVNMRNFKTDYSNIDIITSKSVLTDNMKKSFSSQLEKLSTTSLIDIDSLSLLNNNLSQDELVNQITGNLSVNQKDFSSIFPVLDDVVKNLDPKSLSEDEINNLITILNNYEFMASIISKNVQTQKDIFESFNQTFTNIKKDLKNIEKLRNSTDIQDRINNVLSQINNIPSENLQNIILFKTKLSELDKNDPNYIDNVRSLSEELNVSNFDKFVTLPEVSEIQQLKDGGIIKNISDSIFKLDSEGIDFVRREIKNIPTYENIKKQLRETSKGNTIIYENNQESKESYEIYIMDIITKGYIT